MQPSRPLRSLAVAIALLGVPIAARAQPNPQPNQTQVFSAFTQQARAPDLTAGTTTSRVALGAAAPVARVCNTGLVTVYVALGNATVTATLVGGFPILPGSCANMNAVGAVDLAAITASSTAVLQTSLGTGMASLGGGGGGAPSGTAGGDLGGTYPNPNVLNLANVTNGSLPNAGLLNPSFTIAGHVVALGGTQTLACADLTNASAFCSGTDAAGLTGTVASARISGAYAGITGVGTLASGAVPTSLLTGLGTGVATALGVNVGSAGAPVLNGGALGTPSSGVGTNLTGTAAGLTAGNVTTNANLTGPITSSGNATAINSQTGSGSTFVMNTAPTITGGLHTALTTFGLRDTSAAFDVTLAAASSTNLTAGRTLTFDVVNAARTMKLGANLTIASDPGAVTGAIKSNGTGTFAQAACADLAVTCLTANQTITISGDASGSGTTAITVVNANLPTGVTVAGSLLATEIAAPGTPAAGKVSLWTDTTDARFHDKNPAGTIGTTVVADTGAASNYISAISAAGVISKSRPACATLSDSGTSCTVNTGTSGATIPLLNGTNTASGTWTFSNGTSIALGANGGSTGQMSLKGSTSGTMNITTDATAANLLIATLAQTSAAQSGTMCYNAGSLIVTYDASLGCLSSSMLVKHDWKPLVSALDDVLRMEAGSFWYNDQGAVPGEQVGLNAENIATIDPRLVVYGEDGHPRAVRYLNMVAKLVAAVQELKADNDNLHAELRRPAATR